MDVVAYYHLWTDGAWQQPLAEYRAALDASGFKGTRRFVVVGHEWPDGIVACAAQHEGNEYVTLNQVRAYAADHDGAVLYAHGKGSYDTSEFRDRWRRSMLKRVVEGWKDDLAILARGEADVVGCHWLTEAQYPGMFSPVQTVPAEGSGFFGGNFWMATCEYIRKLPECPPEPRWEAEQWIGQGHPRVVDLLPGWPHDNRWPELCAS